MKAEVELVDNDIVETDLPIILQLYPYRHRLILKVTKSNGNSIKFAIWDNPALQDLQCRPNI